jgi:hypothetical protein
MKKTMMAVISLGILMTACKKDEPGEDACEVAFGFTGGALISNEGAWPNSGSVSHVDLATGKVTNALYEDANCGVTAGASLQSVAVNSTKGYVVSTGSSGGNLQIVDLTSFKNNKSLSFSYPRYIEFSGNSAYLTNGSGTGTVYKISTQSNIVSDSISVGAGPENLIISNGKLIVTNSGGWGVDSSITFIDLATFTIDTTLNIGYHPNDLVEDVNGNIWVSCQGLGNWDPNGPSAPMLYEINPITKEILNSYTVGTSAQTVKRLAINTAMDVIYYYHENGDAFAFNIDGSTLNDQAFIEGSFYGIALDPATDNVITFDAKGFTASSEMSVYSSTGDSLATYSVGIGANGAFVK